MMSYLADYKRMAPVGLEPMEPAFRMDLQRFLLFAAALVLAFHASPAMGQLSTQDHLADPGFWPTQDQPARADFVGPEACARCHRAMTASQVETPMARNMAPAATAEILRTLPALSFSANGFMYRIDTGPSQTGANKAEPGNASLTQTGKSAANYSIAKGDERLEYPLLWAFGTGRVAQSYLFKKDDGGFYEARASYFTTLKSLNFTPGRSLEKPTGMKEAMYRPVGMAEVQRCFSCHATASNVGGAFDEKHLIPGVTCEACHGPGATHVKTAELPAANASEQVKPAIFSPADLLPADAVDFCGACHSSFWDVKLSGGKGVSTTRSAPYRLVTSKCWGKGDARLVCTACHDPHKQLETDASAYDQVCRTCHVSGTGAKPTASHPGTGCPKATSRCTSCHMAKVYVPEMHADFTDHRIRIVQAGEPFPE